MFTSMSIPVVNGEKVANYLGQIRELGLQGWELYKLSRTIGVALATNTW